MRLAIIADIHGNLPAFEAVLDHITHQAVDQTVIAGDIVVGSPDSAACWQLAQSLGCPMVRGNHERYVFQFDTPAAEPLWMTQQFAPLHWAVAQLSAHERASLEAQPTHLRLSDAPELVIVHASLRSDVDSLHAHTPESQLPAMFPNLREQLVVRAHNHVAATRIWNKHTIVTSGSVGLTLDGIPTAKYLIVERRVNDWHITHQSVPYDLDKAVERFHTSGYLDTTGPIGRLYMREVATASFQIVPFLRSYRRWNEREPLSLEAALERFEKF